MHENKSITIKPVSRVAKSRPSWRQLRRNMMISHGISKFTDSIKKSVAIVSPVKKAFESKADTKVAENKSYSLKQNDDSREFESENGWRHSKRRMVINHEVSKFTKTFRESFATLIVSALGVVAALSWNDAIKTAIDTLLPSVGNLVYKFYVAITVTAISVVITYFVSRIKPKN
jgi:hypothetical protein